jgi:hypothetical protein
VVQSLSITLLIGSQAFNTFRGHWLLSTLALTEVYYNQQPLVAAIYSHWLVLRCIQAKVEVYTLSHSKSESLLGPPASSLTDVHPDEGIEVSGSSFYSIAQ